MKFGKLEVMEFSHYNRNYRVYKCKCECGNEVFVNWDNLTSGNSKSCGKCRIRYKDLTGMRFGKLEVLNLDDSKNSRKAYWICKCDCGTVKSIRSDCLGTTLSCGCYNKEKKTNETHKQSRTKLYRVWASMKQRCSNEKTVHFEHYGGRGISYCDDWEIFENFYNWANISGYSEGLTIDRIDVNGNYEPKNCRWISHKEQGVNKRKTIRYEYLGETLTCNEFAEKYNINKNTLYARLSRGCDIREAIEYKR